MKAALIQIGTGDIVATGILPFSHLLADGGTALLTEVGQEVPAHAVSYRVMEYVEVGFDRPSTYYTQGLDVEAREGNVITVTRGWTAWTQQEIDAYESTRLTGIAAAFDVVDNIERAAVLVIMDEVNLHAARIESILQAVAGAASLAAFKTATAAISAPAQRTPAQIKTAIRNKLGT